MIALLQVRTALYSILLLYTLSQVRAALGCPVARADRSPPSRRPVSVTSAPDVGYIGGLTDSCSRGEAPDSSRDSLARDSSAPDSSAPDSRANGDAARASLESLGGGTSTQQDISPGADWGRTRSVSDDGMEAMIETLTLTPTVTLPLLLLLRLP